MKTRTLITAGTALFLCVILTAMQPSQNKKCNVAVQETAFNFSNIKIGEGIKVEFEYGTQLQVLSESYSEDTALNLILSDDTLTITNLEKNSDSPIRLKVVTPGLVGIEKLDPQHTVGLAANGSRVETSIL